MPQNFTSWKTIYALSRHRVAKYKQRRQLNTRPHLKVLENVQIGGCTGLSFTWVQRHQKNPGETPSQRIEYLNTDQAWTNIDYFAGFFNNIPAGSYAERIEVVAPASVGMQRRGSVSERDYESFATALEHIIANPGYHFVMMCLKEVPTNHICALWSGVNGVVFFDPNSGEYKVSKGKIQALLKALTAQYATYVSSTGVKTKLTFREIQFHHVG